MKLLETESRIHGIKKSTVALFGMSTLKNQMAKDSEKHPTTQKNRK